MLIRNQHRASFGASLAVCLRCAQVGTALWTARRSLLGPRVARPLNNGVGPRVAFTRFVTDSDRCALIRCWLGQIRGEAPSDFPSRIAMQGAKGRTALTGRSYPEGTLPSPTALLPVATPVSVHSCRGDADAHPPVE
jgi:hypothetical protein